MKHSFTGLGENTKMDSDILSVSVHFSVAITGYPEIG
jgi:hypothetical protein